jgi:coniferyl-alcohol glucosyltransferase
MPRDPPKLHHHNLRCDFSHVAGRVYVIQSCMSPKLFDIVQLPPVDISGLVDANSLIITRLSIIMCKARPAIRSAISAQNPQPIMLIVDLFGTKSFPIADKLDMLKYAYFPKNAWFLALTMHVPFLDKEVEGEYVDRVELLRLVWPEDMVDPDAGPN